MKRYKIGIFENLYTDYVVEAETPEEAWRLFHIWVVTHAEEVASRLDNNSCGWDFDEPELTSDYPDITHAELLSVAMDGVEEGGIE